VSVTPSACQVRVGVGGERGSRWPREDANDLEARSGEVKYAMQYRGYARATDCDMPGGDAHKY
jgi:hypothetical protein